MKVLLSEQGYVVSYALEGNLLDAVEAAEPADLSHFEECFSVINRGRLWYDALTEEQLSELQSWYRAWLDGTNTQTIPEKPEWLT